MTSNPVKLGIASAIAFAILWIICSAIVYVSPGPMMEVSGHMIHADLSTLSWTLTWPGFIMGLVGWMVVAGVTSWLIALIYKLLSA